MVNAQNDTVLAKTPVRIGLVGCGRLAEFGYIPAFRRAAGVALAGLVDVNPTRCSDLAPQVPAYKSVQDLIEGSGVDAIIVSTPTRYHLADATAAAQAKLPALVEKPPGIDVREAEALARLLPRPWIAFNRRFDPDLARLQRQIVSEETLTVHLELHYRRNAWNPIDMQDDALLDLGPHLVDLARWLTACEVTSVQTRTLKPDYAEFELELERARATITCSCNRPYRERVDAWGWMAVRLEHTSEAGLWRAFSVNCYPVAESVGSITGETTRALRLRGERNAFDPAVGIGGGWCKSHDNP